MTSRHRRTNGERPSGRIRALLSLGVVLPLSFTGTFAAWTDSAEVAGTTLTSGSIDVQLNDLENAASTTLSMANMVPGNTSAEVFTLENAGLSSLKWSLTGGLSGTHAADFEAANPNGIKLTILDGGSRSGTGSTSTCTGGSTLLSTTSLTSTTSTSLVSGQGPLAPSGVKTLCFQITFDAGAPSSLQSKTTGATFTFTGTSDLS